MDCDALKPLCLQVQITCIVTIFTHSIFTRLYPNTRHINCAQNWSQIEWRASEDLKDWRLRWMLTCATLIFDSKYLTHFYIFSAIFFSLVYHSQGFCLRRDPWRFVRSFPVPCPVLWCQYFRDLWTPDLPGELILGFQKHWKQRFWVFY